MAVVGCYSMDLYCDGENPAHTYKEFPHCYTAQLGSTCKKNARKAGWRFLKDGRAYCPKCKEVNRINNPE